MTKCIKLLDYKNLGIGLPPMQYQVTDSLLLDAIKLKISESDKTGYDNSSDTEYEIDLEPKTIDEIEKTFLANFKNEDLYENIDDIEDSVYDFIEFELCDYVIETPRYQDWVQKIYNETSEQ
jgi:hypothetical protein